VSRSTRSGSGGRDSGGRGSSVRRRSGIGTGRVAHRSVKPTTRHSPERDVRRRRELSFVDMLLIVALTAVVVSVSVILWILLRGMF
jgi:hypothetical protein